MIVQTMMGLGFWKVAPDDSISALSDIPAHVQEALRCKQNQFDVGVILEQIDVFVDN